MTTGTTRRFSLDKSTKKYTCPHCRRRTLVRYKDHGVGELSPDHVGRCDRENKCGYHYPPKQYFAEKGIQAPRVERNTVPEPPKPVSFISWEVLKASLKGYETNHFVQFLINLFGIKVASQLVSRYFIGTSKHWSGATTFWQVDENGKIRAGKIMLYNPETGKRVKEPFPHIHWAHKVLKLPEFKIGQCFFGEHLLVDKTKPVAIAESEKTAVIASFFFPQFVWLATGGAAGGCPWREFSVFKVLKDRDVILFPDFGYTTSGKTCFQEWKDRAGTIMSRMKCNIRVSTVLEKNIPEEQRVNGSDLVDFLIKRDEQTGIAVTDEGYPVIWGLGKVSRLN
ncbi:MAG: hypothetical protein KIT80_16105 [Chitinophagaceae bacterium]|nr:hypothetical protein [Chitinophagaceae bacterium]MCW5928440.1 hypothetical protein [Chitinophagaceae bacterium]